MIVRLEKERVHILVDALRWAGEREIGGILMGEHLGTDDFRITELTIQPRQGTIARFVRLVQHAVVELRRFFRETGNNYRRFNYLGEWHSHPLFLPVPSADDDAAMMAIVSDGRVGANFAVLLIAKLVDSGFAANAFVYTQAGRSPAILIIA